MYYMIAFKVSRRQHFLVTINSRMTKTCRGLGVPFSAAFEPKLPVPTSAKYLEFIPVLLRTRRTFYCMVWSHARPGTRSVRSRRKFS